MSLTPPLGSCTVCDHPRRVDIDAQLMTGTSLRLVDAWTQVEGNGPRVPFATLARHKKHLPIPAESLKVGEGLGKEGKVAAIKAEKAKVHAVQTEVSKQNPVFPSVVSMTADDLAALKEAQDFCLRTLRGHAKYEQPKNEPSHPTVRLLAVAVAGIKITAKTRFEILTGKSKPGDGQALAGNISEGLSGLLGSAFDEEPPPMEGNTPGTVDLAAAAWGPTPTQEAPPVAATTPARVPTSEELWNDLPQSTAPATAPPARESGTHQGETTPAPAAPAQPETPRKDFGKLLNFPPLRARQG